MAIISFGVKNRDAGGPGFESKGGLGIKKSRCVYQKHDREKLGSRENLPPLG